MNANWPLCFNIDLVTPDLNESPEKAWQLCKAVPERKGWEVNLVTHVHLWLDQLINASA